MCLCVGGGSVNKVFIHEFFSFSVVVVNVCESLKSWLEEIKTMYCVFSFSLKHLEIP